MKINPQRNKKKLITILAIFVLLAGGTTAYAYYTKAWPFATQRTAKVDLQPATKSQQEAGQKTKQTNSDATANNKPGGSDQPPAPVPQASGKSLVAASINAANQNGATLQVRTLIQTVNSDGTCTLTLSRAGYASVVKTSHVQPLASSSTCQGFDIATNELAKGTWNIQLVFESPTLRGEASQTVNIQ